MKHISFKNEINKTLNSKVYYKPETQIETLNLEKYYKIKKMYLDDASRTQLITMFTDTLKPPLLCKEISNYLDDNYYQPDSYIYQEVQLLVAQVMPDVSPNYITNIQNYVQ